MLFIITGVALFVLGLLGVIVHKEFLRKLISLNVFTSGIFLIFVSTTTREDIADPIVIALVLTGLVVTLGASAFAMMLIRAYAKESIKKSDNV
jgi:multicomponent Na+:H+ antiporter subunit C